MRSTNVYRPARPLGASCTPASRLLPPKIDLQQGCPHVPGFSARHPPARALAPCRNQKFPMSEQAVHDWTQPSPQRLRRLMKETQSFRMRFRPRSHILAHLGAYRIECPETGIPRGHQGLLERAPIPPALVRVSRSGATSPRMFQKAVAPCSSEGRRPPKGDHDSRPGCVAPLTRIDNSPSPH